MLGKSGLGRFFYFYQEANSFICYKFHHLRFYIYLMISKVNNYFSGNSCLIIIYIVKLIFILFLFFCKNNFIITFVM